MILKGLKLDFFRNYVHLETDFDPRVNLIYGENAQGKTNLLEAIGFLSGAKSHRARGDKELISFHRDRGTITAQVESRGREFLIEAQLFRGARRKLSVNHVKCKTAGELSGIVQTVLFCPEDLALIKSGAAERRAFLDQAICQLRPRYAEALSQ
jgi:DNA replication and repair protein RecF